MAKKRLPYFLQRISDEKSYKIGGVVRPRAQGFEGFLNGVWVCVGREAKDSGEREISWGTRGYAKRLEVLLFFAENFFNGSIQVFEFPICV